MLTFQTISAPFLQFINEFRRDPISDPDRDTEQLFHEEKNRRFAAIDRVALRKLLQLNRTSALQNMAVHPGNRLEALNQVKRLWAELFAEVVSIIGPGYQRGVSPEWR